MTLVIRRLGPGDEASLARMAADDADFDLAGRGGPLRPLDPLAAQHYLANPAVLHWVAVEADAIIGFLYCLLVPLRAGPGQEVLLYEVGVRQGWRRRGVGRALLAHMQAWMASNAIAEVWVCADNPAAVAFYQACGFGVAGDQPVYMTMPPADDAA